MEEKLNQILSDPQMMGRIMELASSLGASQEDDAQDPGSLGKLMDVAGGIDSHQQALLEALTPYMSPDRVARLERAMRAARMARMASNFLGNGGLQLLTGGNAHL